MLRMTCCGFMGGLAVDLDLLFLVDDVAMDHLRDLEFVGLGAVVVQDNLRVGEELHPDALPVSFPDRPWARGSLFGELRLQLEKAKRRRRASLNNAAPLFPLCIVSPLDAVVCAFANVNLVDFRILPIATVSDVLLLHGDIPGARNLQVGIDSLHWLVVHIQHQMSCLRRDPCHCCIEHSRLLARSSVWELPAPRKKMG